MEFSLTNRAFYTGSAEIFHLMVIDPKDVPSNVPTATDRLDIQYVGARVVTTTVSTSPTLVITNNVEFAIKTVAPRMLPVEVEFDINIDLNGDGNPEYIIFNANRNFVETGGTPGANAVYVYNVATSRISGPYSFTDTNVWSSGLVERVPAAAIGLSTLKKFNFWVEAYWNFPYFTTPEEEYAPAPLLDRAPDSGSVAFNAALVRFNPSRYNLGVAQGTTQVINVYANPLGWLNANPAEHNELGMMIYYRDNVPPDRDVDIVQMSFPFNFTVRQLAITVQASNAGYVTSRTPTINNFLGEDTIWAGDEIFGGRDTKYYGVMQFDLMGLNLPISTTIYSASVELTGKDNRYNDPTITSTWMLQLLNPSADANWQNVNYYTVASSGAQATLQPTLTDADLAPGRVNVFNCTGTCLNYLGTRFGSTGKATFRIASEPHFAVGRNLFGWDARGNPPVLRMIVIVPQP